MFNMDGIIFDSILSGVAENTKGEFLYRLTQLTDASIEVTAEEKNAVDKNGTLIKKSYRAKAAALTATNAMLDLNAYAETTGTEKIVASAANKVQAPKIILVESSKTEFTLPATAVPLTGTIQVIGLKAAGTMAAKYTLAAAGTATTTEFAYDSTGHKVTFPTNVAADVSEFMIKYEYETEEATMVVNYSNKWPKTIKLTLQALAFDQCEPDVLRLCYIIFDSFQVDPQTTLSMTTDATFEFKGSAQASACAKGTNTSLYKIIMADNDVEDGE